MKTKKKSKKKGIIAAVALVLVLALILAAVNLGRRGQEMSAALAAGEIRSAEVTSGSISNVVSGAGTLTGAEGQKVTVPEGVELESIAVEAGDRVKAGDLLATVDRSSVLSALAETQEQLDELDEQLEEQEEDTVSSKIKAGVSGRVKAIWAEEGDSVGAVAAEQGGLLLLSMDGKMAVTLPASAAVSLGDTVTVTLSDGDTKEGTVAEQSAESLVVTLTDNGPLLGDTVTVTAEDGSSLGSGTLSVHSPLVVTGYTGTVSSVKVEENEKVSAGTTLFKLTDLGHTAEYEALLAQRQQLAERLQALSALNQDNRITAPFDGTVQTVEADSTGSAQTGGYSALAGSNATPGGVTLLTAVSDGGEGQGETDPQPTEPEQPEEPEEPEQPVEPEQPEEPEQPAPVTVTLEAQLQLEGGALADYAGKFTLCLSGEGNTQQKTNDAAGRVTFDDLTFETAGSYVYRLYQAAGGDSRVTYDSTLYTLTVNVTLEEGILKAAVVPEQQLVFVNQLSAAQEAQTPEQPAASSGGNQSSSGFPSLGGTSGSGGGSGSVSVSGVTSTGVTSGGSSTSDTGADVETGETTVLTLSPEDTMTVSVTVDELDILSIQLGQAAAVTVDALESDSIIGTVTGIDTTGISAGGVTKYTVEITVDKTEQMLSNMSASVEIVIEQTDNCLTIPEAALQQKGAATYVYTSYDQESGSLGGETQVTTGVSDGTNVEITGGLSQGDTVYYRYAEAGDSFSLFGGGMMPSTPMGEHEGYDRGNRGGAEGGMPAGQP
ncbi:MAG: HlyD family efflux transporter periplasmic adaptor subunit [Candidatus Onthomonas sp.]